MKKTFGLGPSGTLMGEGTPKICIPIVAETVEEIRKKAEEISLFPAEVVEWRADFYEDIFVEGKLEGFRGHVVDVCYTFKIKLSDYKRVISVADTKVHGEFHFAGSHFVTFDRSALPYEQIITWFKAPEKENTEIVSE